MKTLLQAIREITRPDLHCSGTLVLEENDPASRLRPVKLSTSGQALMLKLDALPPPLCAQQFCQLRYTPNDRMFPLFRVDMEGLTAICDYLIFYQEKGGADARLFVLLCELKSGRPDHAKPQIENGKLMADYLLAMAGHHVRVHVPAIEWRGLVFSPRCELPPIRNPRDARYNYGEPRGRMPDLRFAYCRDGASYSLSYFCA